MSFKIYPVTPVDPVCEDYTVKINGKTAATNTARVSAVPFNRRWPGHQRDISQSEPIQFLSLETDEPLCFEITPSHPFEEVKIRPKSLGVEPVIEGGKIKFTLPRPAYFTVEAYGRNRALHVFADPVSDYKVAKNSADVIYFGAGEHDVGVIELQSNQTLYLDEGAVVYARVQATDAENIKILGRGILDNSKNKEQILFEANEENNRAAVNNAKREYSFHLQYCKNVVIDGITVRDSLVYNIRPVACENLSIRNVKIIGCWRYNSDGIDMHNCLNVHIRNCFVRTYDDCICVKGFDCFYNGNIAEAVKRAMYRGGRSYDVFKNVLVENCVLWNDWGKCLEIGAETKAEEICDVVFRDCEIIHATHVPLDCMNVDYADVHDVLFENITVDLDENIPAPDVQRSDAQVYENTDPDYSPRLIGLSVVYHHEYSAGSEDRRGKNRNFTFNNIRVLGDKAVKFKFAGYDEEHKIENVLIKNLTLNGKPVTSFEETEATFGPFCENISIE